MRKSLTWNELNEMVGKKVWLESVEALGEKIVGEWVTIDSFGRRNQQNWMLVTNEYGEVDEYSQILINKYWNAYLKGDVKW